ncbi:Superkiller protein 3 [Puccinia graminis f. sp. tritici]|uniref:Superkiller protein 3 n=1 Tax=Puccinia graminis f. sp. tritici TaxID=56615 RepID=A0A5B0S744_PUCGR|nr:Superkiller protein 3 [Puccinia graminis f. sp. tritici]KAA1133648.1 Superkiller protein 3 [Puccinia graminis f. sp. tritici]
MATLKAHLKSARDAISAKDWEKAQASAEAALAIDNQSYNAYVFLGLAQLNLKKVSESEAAYRAAIKIDQVQPLAWQALISLYEQQHDFDRLIADAQSLMHIWNEKGDAEKLGELILKMMSFPQKSRKQSVAILSLVLSDSPFHSLLSTLPEPDHTNPEASPLLKLQDILVNTLPTLNEIIELVQTEQDEAISREITKRRTRLTSVPKTAAQTRADVINEVYPTSVLPKYWQQVLDHPLADDITRRDVEAKLLTFYMDWLESLPSPFTDETPNATKKSSQTSESQASTKLKNQEAKDSIRHKIEDLARGQAILRIPNQKAWDIVLDWGEVLPDDESTDSYGFLKNLPEAMPDAPLSTLVLAFQQIHSETEAEEEDVAFEDPLEQIEISFEGAQDHSILSHVLTASVYFDLKEWSTVIRVAQGGLTRLAKLEKTIGKRLSTLKRRLTIHLACALTYENPPVHHPRATRYLDAILSDEPSNGHVLMAKACVLRHSKHWQLANELYSRSLEASPYLTSQERLEVRLQQAWCLYEVGNVNLAIQNLEQIVEGCEELVEQDAENQECVHILAQSWYQLGRCKWTQSHPDHHNEAGSDLTHLEEIKHSAYTCFIKSIKYDTSIASSFSYLGLYYDEQNDHTRSSKCFQRAFELDATQEIAAFKLASEFADNRQWDLVAVVTKRLLFGGVPQKTQLSTDEDESTSLTSLASYQQHVWAWKAAGVVQLSEGKFTAAINTFQRAIRCSPNDHQILLKLGLAYQGAGKHVAALKSFIAARQLIDTQAEGASPPNSGGSSAWYVNFCIGDSQRQLGLLEPAIKNLEKIVENRPEEFGVKVILAETKYTMGLKNSEKGAFAEAEYELAKCLDIVRDVLEKTKSRLVTKACWKITGNVFAEFARWNRTIPMTTFLVDAGGSDSNENLRAHLSYFVNLAAKMNIDNILTNVKSVICLETSAILSENGSPGVFLLLSALAFKVRLVIELSESQKDSAAEAWSDLAIALGGLSRWLDPTSSKLASSDPSAFFKTQMGPQATLSEAVHCIKAGLQMNSFSSGAWNTLGVLTFSLNPRLSQHAFIRSVELLPKNHIAWTNLGFFYVTHSDLELANEAFERAQLIEPDWSLSWMGQALIASLNGQQQKAGELVEHAYSLSLGSITTIESCYATVTLKTFTNDAQKSSQHTSTLIAPMLAAEKLLKRYPKDPTFLNLHALISECLGNFDEAAGSLERSAELLEAVYEVTESIEVEQRFMLANLNLGRIRLRQKDYEEAIAVLETVLGLRPPFDKNTEPMESAFKSTIIRAQAACQIAMARYFLQDSEKCLTLLDEALRELNDLRQDESLGLSKKLAPYSSAVSGLIARVLWSQSNRSKAKEVISDMISKNSSEKFIDYDLISSFLAITILEGGSDEALQAALNIKDEYTDQSAEQNLGSGEEVSIDKAQIHKKEDMEIISRLQELILRTAPNKKITRDPKSETNTILNFLEFTIKLLTQQPSHNEHAFVKSFDACKEVLSSCIRQVRETEIDKQLIKQRAIIFKSFDEEQLPAPASLTDSNKHHSDLPGGQTGDFIDDKAISLSDQLNFLV